VNDWPCVSLSLKKKPVTTAKRKRKKAKATIVLKKVPMKPWI